MTTRIRLFLAALLVCVYGAGNSSAARSAAAEPASMRFDWVRDGKCEAPQCREWIAASGPVTADTVRDFDLFAEGRDVRGATLALDSGGGSVLASLELGRTVRELGMRTTVGVTVRSDDGAQREHRGSLLPRGECASMCVFVLLGGVSRTVPAEARILVHQIWPGAKRYDAGAESYTAEEMVRIQRDVGRMARYIIEMGGDIELFELAMRIPPWERLRALTRAELKRTRLHTTEAAVEMPSSGVTGPERVIRATMRALSVRGWQFVESDDKPALTRRHVLTVEGDEIGHFDLTLSCEEGVYTAAYSDSRVALNDSNKLREVTLWSGGDRISLQLRASTIGREGLELRTEATGAVPSGFLERLQNDAEGVVVVGTKSSDNLRTSIRVGVAGFAKGFRQLAAGCDRGARLKTAGPRVEAAAMPR